MNYQILVNQKSRELLNNGILMGKLDRGAKLQNFTARNRESYLKNIQEAEERQKAFKQKGCFYYGR